ncbi:MAG: hypothetical protein DDG58_11680 [Ardenticatenia bacterium]|nr:MAG: hypothetical protein DDG58_11680 [Ardenticatenia bacterium]
MLPPYYGKQKRIYKCFARWSDQGAWERMVAHFTDNPNMECDRGQYDVVGALRYGRGSKKAMSKLHGLRSASGKV